MYRIKIKFIMLIIHGFVFGVDVLIYTFKNVLKTSIVLIPVILLGRLFQLLTALKQKPMACLGTFEWSGVWQKKFTDSFDGRCLTVAYEFYNET